MAEGTVKWFDDAKGYGLSTPAEGSKDLFVHHSEIPGDGFKSLPEGAKVSFEAREGQKGRRRQTSPLSRSQIAGRPWSSQRPRAPRPKQLSTKGVRYRCQGREDSRWRAKITEPFRNRMFRLKLDNGHEMIGYTAGR